MKCQYCADPAVVRIVPFPGAGYTQDLCQRHYDKGNDMAREQDPACPRCGIVINSQMVKVMHEREGCS